MHYCGVRILLVVVLAPLLVNVITCYSYLNYRCKDTDACRSKDSCLLSRFLLLTIKIHHNNILSLTFFLPKQICIKHLSRAPTRSTLCQFLLYLFANRQATPSLSAQILSSYFRIGLSLFQIRVSHSLVRAF